MVKLLVSVVLLEERADRLQAVLDFIPEFKVQEMALIDIKVAAAAAPD
jgi:hypothetical protein